MTKYFTKSAFTLTEVLITLLIIGVIASIVVPNLINDSKKAEYVTKLQKEYAVLQQAYKLILLDNGGSILNDPNFNCSGTCSDSESANAMNEFAEKLNVIKNCGNSSGCWYNTSLRFLGGGDYSSDMETYWDGKWGKAILADGTLMLVTINSDNCATIPGTTSPNSPLYGTVCGAITIDVNGTKGPNQLGRDYFGFWITKTGLLPRGIYNDGMSCNMNSSTYATSCGCAGKIISEGAMNY